MAKQQKQQKVHDSQASCYELEALVGRRVRALREFANIPDGTEGKVVRVYRIGRRHRGIDVHSFTQDNITDGFGRDDDFDETEFLEVVG